MFQTNNDADDLGDFLPYLMDYINEGYDRLAFAWTGEHPEGLGETDTPLLPEWTHHAIADWATWMVYRNGNPQKQNRGYAFRNAFDEVLGRMISEGGSQGKPENFFNIPR